MLLIVDGYSDTSLALQKLLSWDGIPAQCVSNAKEVVATAEKSRPRMIILEQMMPGMLGTAILRRIRSSPLISKTPVMFCCENDHGKDLAAALGAVDWLNKTLGWDELRRRIVTAYEASPRSQ